MTSDSVGIIPSIVTKTILLTSDIFQDPPPSPLPHSTPTIPHSLLPLLPLFLSPHPPLLTLFFHSSPSFPFRPLSPKGAELRLDNAVKQLYPNSSGTRLVVIDNANGVYLFNPVTGKYASIHCHAHVSLWSTDFILF